MQEIFLILQENFRDSNLNVSFKTTIALKTAELHLGIKEAEVLKILKYADDHKIILSDKKEALSIYKKILGSKKKSKKLLLIIPINCNLNKRKFEFRKRLYQVYTGKGILRKYGKIKFSNYRNPKSRGLRINSHQKYFLTTESFGSDIFDGIINIYEELECLSGLMNVMLDRKLSRINFARNTNEALFDFGTIIYSITDENHQYLSWARKTIGLTATRSIYSIDENTTLNISLALKKLKKLDTKKGSIGQIITDSLILYYRAKTSIENENEYMYYWRVCENIVLSEKIGGDTMKTLSRVFEVTKFAKRFRFKITILKKQLSTIRNNYVHKGKIKFDTYYTSIIGSIANESLFWLIDHRDSLNSERVLLNYLTYMDLNNKEIKSKIAALKEIEDLRK